MAKPRIAPYLVAAGLIIGLAACTNPYDPAQRAVGGGLLGAGAGAAIGAAAGGGHGAALGAAIGGVTGALAGIVTTPPPPAYYGYRQHRRYARYAGRSHRCVHCRQAARNTAPGGWTNPGSE